MCSKIFASAIMSFMLLTSVASAQQNVTAAEARAIAREAYIFNYSLVMMYRTMYIQSIDTESGSYSGGFAQWLHLGTSTPQDTDIVSPNNDSPYSYAWVDTRAEPWVLKLPKIEKDRFYTSQWNDSWSFVIGNAGSISASVWRSLTTAMALIGTSQRLRTGIRAQNFTSNLMELPPGSMRR